MIMSTLSTTMAISSFPLHSFSPKLPNLKPCNICRRNNKSSLIRNIITDSTATTTSDDQPPLRAIPGDYGLPLIGPLRDRQDYFYNQGEEKFFKSRIQKYNSTVFRTNMPPGPFISSNPKVIALLDAKSFKNLFDIDKVEKKDLFTGTYMPSTDLTGGYRILSYLDPSEPKHKALKQLLFYLLTNRKDRVIPEFQNIYGNLFDTLEKELSSAAGKKGKVKFDSAHDQAAFNFLARSFFNVSPSETKLGSDGPKLIQKWVLFNLHPLLSLGLPRIIEDPLLHTFSLPPFLVKKDYNRLYEFFYENSTSLLDHANSQLGLSREEACHNLLFATCFNSFGGIKILFPYILRLVSQGGSNLHTQLATEIRSALDQSSGGQLTMSLIERSMPLVKSVVYECLRLEPPVPAQYAKAKKSFVVESHDARYEVKEGEMLYGFQPLATKDPKIFDRPEEFVPDRFVGEEGEKLLQYVLWSNGPEDESPSVNNKQCAGKDFVILASRLFVVELFRRYDSIDVEVSSSALGIGVTLTSMTRAPTPSEIPQGVLN